MGDTSTTKRDCFAYDERKCKALKERYCDHEKCNFYKTRAEFEAGFNPEEMKAYSKKKNESS
ncbi:MAG: hypothetical protein IJC06_04120 [Clostridia bacterium]|nr:hypothetical protein [Clostridia bacterium]